MVRAHSFRRVNKMDRVVVDRALWERMVSMLEANTSMRYRLELAERHIALLNKDMEEIRGKINI